MGLFTPQERDTIKNAIIEELKGIDGILAVILVGSGAAGFTDDISDLDFSIVIDNGCDMAAVMKRVNGFVCARWKILNAMEMEKRGLQVYILDNYLEIDIGYAAFQNVSAIRERWLVVYDATGRIDSIMKQSWEVNKNNHGKKESVDIEQAYSTTAEDIWHYLMHGVVGIKRGNYWRAIGEMDIARNMLIELLGYRYSLETKRFRNVDMFPADIKDTLKSTIPVKFNLPAFRNSIYVMIEAAYDELEAFYGTGSEIKVTREHVKEYCSSILGDE